MAQWNKMCFYKVMKLLYSYAKEPVLGYKLACLKDYLICCINNHQALWQISCDAEATHGAVNDFRGTEAKIGIP